MISIPKEVLDSQSPAFGSHINGIGHAEIERNKNDHFCCDVCAKLVWWGSLNQGRERGFNRSDCMYIYMRSKRENCYFGAMIFVKR